MRRQSTNSRREATVLNIAVNCGAIPPTLLDSELFGHEKGAFTGATARKRGRFERADRGTLFLDEVGELPLEAQTRMLRVLETREIERVGGTAPVQVDIRIIAATNRDLEEMITAGAFREDLWYRLNVFPIQIPPLRERSEDIPELVQYFVNKKGAELRLHPVPAVDREALDRLVAYHWPGNVRELENVVEREMILCEDGRLKFDQLRPVIHEATTQVRTVSLKAPLPLDDVVADHIRHTLERTKGKVHGPGGAAELLGINPSTLRHKMEKFGVSFGRVR